MTAPSLKDYTPHENKQQFVKYAALELALGGPDPHVAEATHMAQRGQPTAQDLAWRAGCYIAVYTVAGGMLLWDGLSPMATDAQVRSFVADVWEHLPLRGERKLNGSMNAARLSDCLCSYRDWALNDFPSLMTANYEVTWRSAHEHIKYMGRYAVNKLLEALRRLGLMQAWMPDIRPRGGKYPRLAVSHMACDPSLRRGDSRLALERVNAAAEDLRCELSGELGQKLDYFTFETLLCNYRQALKSKYPGRGHDSELGYYQRTLPYWEQRDPGYLAARAALWDPRCLGEAQGWAGTRPELGETWPKHGYFWSDLLFNYGETTDLASPARWA